MPVELLERPTSAQAPMRSARRPLRVLSALYSDTPNLASVVTSTSATYDVFYIDAGTQADPVCRLHVPAAYPARTTADDVLEIRFLSGLTWEELGELFRVSRRSVHNWANGEALKPDNIILVGEVLRTIKELRRPSSTETRLALLFPLPSGQRALDLLRAGRWAEAVAAVKGLPPIPIPASPHPDPNQPHPTAYFGALTDRPAPTSGRIVPGRTRRFPRHTP